MSMTHQQYEQWIVRQKQEAYAMEQNQIKKQDAMGLLKEVDEVEQYRSVIDRQMMELQTQLNFLRSTVETFEHRLHPVLADIPVTSHDQEKLTTANSPIAFAVIRPLCNDDTAARMLVESSMDEYRAIEAKLKEKNT